MLTDIEWLALFVFLLLAYVPAIVSLPFTKDAKSQYESYTRSCSVPSWLFGVVWTILYTLIGVSGFLFWRSDATTTDAVLYATGLSLWGYQLVLNALWCWIFFGLGHVVAAAIDLIMLLLATGATVGVFFAVNTTAGALLTPYLVWLAFAMGLTIDIWIKQSRSAL